MSSQCSSRWNRTHCVWDDFLLSQKLNLIWVSMASPKYVQFTNTVLLKRIKIPSLVRKMLTYSLGLIFRKTQNSQSNSRLSALSATQGRAGFMEMRMFWKLLWILDTFIICIVPEAFSFIEIECNFCLTCGKEVKFCRMERRMLSCIS